MPHHPDIATRLTQLVNDFDPFDPWYDLDDDCEPDDLESEYAEFALQWTE